MSSGAIFDCRCVQSWLSSLCASTPVHSGTLGVCSAWVWGRASGAAAHSTAAAPRFAHALPSPPEPQTSPSSAALSRMVASFGRVTVRPCSPPVPSSTAPASLEAPCSATAAARASHRACTGIYLHWHSTCAVTRVFQRHLHRLQLPLQPRHPRRRHLRRAVLRRLNHKQHLQKQQVTCRRCCSARSRTHRAPGRFTDYPPARSMAAPSSARAAASACRQAARPCPPASLAPRWDKACAAPDVLSQDCALLGCSAGRGGAWASDSGSGSISNRLPASVAVRHLHTD
jgi:hypothetical protein